MKTVNIDQLVDKFNAGECSAEEEQILKGWLHQYNMEGSTGLSDEDLFSAQTSMLEAIEAVRFPKVKKLKLWPRITAIAAVVATIAIGAGLFYYNQSKLTDQNFQTANKTDITPGKVGATLTLANGKKISLTDASKGELANESGISISKTAEGQVVYEVKANNSASNKINTLTTAKGETYILTLPDKSTVWMNAASSLTYSVALLERGVRRVKLEGEAYFQIAKDKAHPFIVESGDQQVEVLGTHFNVRAYKGEKVFRTTLLEGSVKVTGDGKTKVLSPGFEAINTSGEIRVGKADTEWAVAWKNNKFIFDSQQIEDIMPMIERWYNVEVIYTGEMPSDTFWGSVSRYDNISKVLGALESTGNVHFKIEGRKVYVSR
ncbi:FecR family protein [Pedobacter hiemivivus]|uniref:FecR family protein n=1 Tax=Pedobacter hiemivivus TaxID=2530454 RepID=A0A4R0NEG8_9SPHI|nr:FecR family protein [Pedobacter hiemivivus]TCC98831.1 FecR family protein [Pedobacter hiemivivus]